MRPLSENRGIHAVAPRPVQRHESDPVIADVRGIARTPKTEKGLDVLYLVSRTCEGPYLS
jgi:hypothetical protein